MSALRSDVREGEEVITLLSTPHTYLPPTHSLHPVKRRVFILSHPAGFNIYCSLCLECSDCVSQFSSSSTSEEASVLAFLTFLISRLDGVPFSGSSQSLGSSGLVLPLLYHLAADTSMPVSSQRIGAFYLLRT